MWRNGYATLFMKITKSSLVYNLACNPPISFALSLAGALLASSTINWANFAINFAISLTIAMLVGLFVPITRIGRAFTAFFHIDNRTYTHNLAYRLLATLAGTFIFFFAISPVLSVVNYFLVPGSTPLEVFLAFLRNFPLLFLIDFTATLLSDLPAYRLAHYLDPDF
jgi:hypothetical protein